MDRVAVFVDAGYLFAQGSAALAGEKLPRTALIFGAPQAIESLKSLAAAKCDGCKLLRIYWYDGAVSGARPTSDHATLAHSDDVKLRLGFINSSGQQKGVDSLIVTDLIELARLKSISDAILLSGDEDVRIGVQIAQNYGVRVHLLGIRPSRGSQSAQLMQEADTTAEWDADDVRKFLTIRSDPSSGADRELLVDHPVEPGNASGGSAADIETATLAVAAELEENELRGIAAYWSTDRGIPADIDRKLLSACRNALGRSLDRSETKLMRSAFQKAAKERLRRFA